MLMRSSGTGWLRSADQGPMESSGSLTVTSFKKLSDVKEERWERRMVTFGMGVEHNYVANSAMAHLPQVKCICSNVREPVLLLFLNPILHMTPQFIGLNFDGKCLFGRGADYPAEQRGHDSLRHGIC